MTMTNLSKAFGIEVSSVKYLLRLMDRHGFHILQQKNKYSSYKGTIGKIADNHNKAKF